MNIYSDYYVKQVFQRRRDPSRRTSAQKFHLSYKVSFPKFLFFLVPQSSPGPINVNIWGRDLFVWRDWRRDGKWYEELEEKEINSFVCRREKWRKREANPLIKPSAMLIFFATILLGNIMVRSYLYSLFP
jgi:hypothetical protein